MHKVYSNEKNNVIEEAESKGDIENLSFFLSNFDFYVKIPWTHFEMDLAYKSYSCCVA